MWVEPLNEDLLVLEEKAVKATARCPLQYVLMDAHKEKYLLVVGRTDIQKFYIERAIEYQREWYIKYNKYGFNVNLPLFFWNEREEIKVLYIFIDNLEYVKDSEPIKYINRIYENDIKVIRNSEENINLMLECFLDAWPFEFHQRIRNLSLFNKYKKVLKKQKEIRICLEHGDFTINNILMTQKRDIYLMDFEFAKRNQPIGMDKLDYIRTRDGKYRKIEYFRLNKIKYELMEQINCMLDGVEFCKLKVWDRIWKMIKNEVYNKWKNL